MMAGARQAGEEQGFTRRVPVPESLGPEWGPRAFASLSWHHTWFSAWTFLRKPVYLCSPGS